MNQMTMLESGTREALIQKWKRTASGVMDGWRYAAEFIAETIESNPPEVALGELKDGLTRAGCMAVSEYYEAAIGEVTALIEGARKMRDLSEAESAELKRRFKAHFASKGIDSDLPTELEAARSNHPLEWDEACHEFKTDGKLPESAELVMVVQHSNMAPRDAEPSDLWYADKHKGWDYLTPKGYQLYRDLKEKFPDAVEAHRQKKSVAINAGFDRQAGPIREFLAGNTDRKLPETQEPKWFVGVLKEINGEQEYRHKVLLQVCGAPEDTLRDVAKAFYDDAGAPIDDGFYHCGGTIIVQPFSVAPVDAAEAAVLQKVLSVFRDDAAIEWTPPSNKAGKLPNSGLAVGSPDPYEAQERAHDAAHDRKLPEVTFSRGTTPPEKDGVYKLKDGRFARYWMGQWRKPDADRQKAEQQEQLDSFPSPQFRTQAHPAWSECDEGKLLEAQADTREQILVALLSQVAVPGGIPEHEFSRPGGWLERAQKALAGQLVEMGLMRNLHELRLKNDNLRAALTEVSELLDGLGEEISLKSIEEDYISRARYLAEVAVGKRDPFVESVPAVPSPSM
ncbi:hypothetical protein VI03_24740 [Burkholderia vietnamiensis]|uniref:hypothetical protein n=1 Tax=Burkholderia vietnamiensis TaxID=60552 RepID=UPI0006224637|nr:hypothetical protein [Burkholderia vietnamiensis]KKI35995.1 hypothetical protein VI03_24740 [Burkholderia vietnamiensis]